MSNGKKVFLFNYKKYRSKSIDIETLNELEDVILSGGTSKRAAIIAGIKLLLFSICTIARYFIVKQQFSIAKQGYEMNRINENDDILDEDSLDVIIEKDNLD